ncbi:MAG TPA: class I SAM-dependent methyltransferase [Bryobacteraceae bacterium]|nr:class I SAM-dependent methyltransferase [Bryobacteraceae bacterium]
MSLRESLPEKLRGFLRGSRAAGQGAAPRSAASFRNHAGRSDAAGEKVSIRHSRGMEQFFGYIRDQFGLTILDLGGAYQENVSFITGLGHRLYSEDMLTILQETFGVDDFTDQSNPSRIEYFLRQSLDYQDEQFDGVLIWDALEFMAPPLLSATIDRLYRIVKPRSYLLAFFHSQDRPGTVPYYTFRIQDFNSLQVTEYGAHQPAQLFNNRTLEKMFQKYESVKFFLTREHLREVIIKR